MTVVLNDVGDFTLDTLERIAVKGEAATIGETGLNALTAANRAFTDYVTANSEDFIYGVTSDYGPHAGRKVDSAGRATRKALGVPFLGLSFGDGDLEEAQVRAMVFAMLALFLRHGAAVRPEAAVALTEILKGGLPKIPDAGLTSPGEILPLFYLLRAVPELIGIDGLQASAGNTAAASVGSAGIAAIRARRRLVLAHKVFALSVEAMKAPLEHFDPALKELWGDPHEAAALDSVGLWLAGVPEAGRRAFQAPVSYRILPRVLGQCGRAVGKLRQNVDWALGAMVSNPMFIGEDLGEGPARAISTGGYHNAPVAQALEGVAAAWVDLAALAHRHAVKLHRGAVSHLPDRLVREGELYWSGRSTTYMEFLPNDSIDEMRRWAEPALLSPGEPGASLQDDVSAPGLIACRNEARVGRLFDRVLTVLAAVACHALQVTERPPPPRLAPFAAAIARRFPPIEEKRVLGVDAATLCAAFTEAVVGANDLLTDDDLAAAPVGLEAMP